MEADPAAAAIMVARLAIQCYHDAEAEELLYLELARQHFEIALERSSDRAASLEALIGLSHTRSYLADIDTLSCAEHAQTAVAIAERAYTLYFEQPLNDLEIEARIQDALGCALQQRCVYWNDMGDCTHAIAAHRKSLELTSAEASAVAWSMRHSHLANALYTLSRGEAFWPVFGENLKEAFHMNGLAGRGSSVDQGNHLSNTTTLLFGGILALQMRYFRYRVNLHSAAEESHPLAANQDRPPEPEEGSQHVSMIKKTYLAAAMHEHPFMETASILGLFSAVLLSIRTLDPTEEFTSVGQGMLEALRNKSLHIDLRHVPLLIDILDLLVSDCKFKLRLEITGLIEAIGEQLNQILPQSHLERPHLHYFLGLSSFLDQRALQLGGSCNVNFFPALEQYRHALRLTPDWHPAQIQYLFAYTCALFHSSLASGSTAQNSDTDDIFRECMAWSGVRDILLQSLGAQSVTEDGFRLVRELFNSDGNWAEKLPNVAKHLKPAADHLAPTCEADSPPELGTQPATIFSAELYLAASRALFGRRESVSASRQHVDEAVHHLQRLYERLDDPRVSRSEVEFGLGEAIAFQGVHELHEQNYLECYRLLSRGIGHMERVTLKNVPRTLTDITNMSTLATHYMLQTIACWRLQRYICDPSESIQTFQYAAAAAISLRFPPEVVYKVFERWAIFASLVQDESALEAYSGQITSLARLSWVGVDVQDRYGRLRQANRSDSVAGCGAAYACGRGMANLAVELLETGRSILFSQTLPLRNRYTELRASEPELVSELERVGKAIDERSFQVDQAPSGSNIWAQMPRDEKLDEAYQLRSLGEEWDDLVARVRRIQGYEDFLQTPPIDRLCQAAANGPVVLIITSEKHKTCYAIVIKGPSVDAIQLVKLPITPSRVKELAKRFEVIVSEQVRAMRTHRDEEDRGFKRARHEAPQMDIYEVLTDLWRRVMKPIIENLTQDLNHESHVLQHIWISPTGELSSLPLHAAGEYTPSGTTVESECVLDHVVCSYTPSLSALLRRSSDNNGHLTRIFALGGGEGLFQTAKEVDIVRSICSQRATVNSLPGRASIEQVKAQLRDAHIVHFACHGMQDPTNPLKSRLMFSKDVEIEVEELMREPLPNARLAVLLACETAQGDRELTDESLHLAGTMLFAGFRGAIGSLWKMADIDGPKICEEFYNALLEGDGDEIQYHRAGEALHRAVCKLKASGVSVFRWATFVHIGQ